MKLLLTGIFTVLILIFIVLYHLYGFFLSPSGLTIFISILFTLILTIFILSKKKQDIIIYSSLNTKIVSKNILYVWPIYAFTITLFIILIIIFSVFLYNTLLFPEIRYSNNITSGHITNMFVIIMFLGFGSIILTGSTLITFLIALIYYHLKK